MSSTGLSTTFAALQASGNKAVVRALVPALDSPYPGIQQHAFELLLSRNDAAASLGLIQRYHILSQTQRDALGLRRERMLGAVRQAIVSRNPQIFQNGCEAAVALEQFDLAPTLLNAIESPVCPFRSQLLGVFNTLIDVFLSRWRTRDESEEDEAEDHCELLPIRARLVTSLSESVARYAQHRSRDILRAFLLLVDASHPVLLEILNSPLGLPFATTLEILTTEPVDAVFPLLRDLLLTERTPTAVLTVVGKRSDPAFVHRFLDFVGPEFGDALGQNFKRLKRLAMLEGDLKQLASLSGPRQATVMRLVMHSAVERMPAFEVLKFLLLQGKVEARREAATALAEFRGAEANTLATEGLSDPDPEVQARIAAQLRDRGIPGSLVRLVEMLQSPHEMVRHVVGETLPEFQFERYWNVFDQLAPEVQQSTGRLVLIVDPDTPEKLEAELRAPVRGRRLQALAAAQMLGLVQEVESAIFDVVRTGDRELRTEAILALAGSHSGRSLKVLSEALGDASPLVQTAARNVLRQRLATESPSPAVTAAQP